MPEKELFKKTIRNEKWEKVEILKKQLKKHRLKLQKKKKQKRDLKKLSDSYASSRPCILSNLFIFYISIILNETPLGHIKENKMKKMIILLFYVRYALAGDVF